MYKLRLHWIVCACFLAAQVTSFSPNVKHWSLRNVVGRRAGPLGAKGKRGEAPNELEFSRPILIDKLAKGRTLRLTPTPIESEKLADRVGLPQIHSLEANVTSTIGALKDGILGA